MIPVVIPGLDSLVSELSGVKIVLESLEDCVGAVDTVEISEKCSFLRVMLLFKPDFKGKSVLLVAFLEELLHSLGSDVSEML